MTRKSDQLLSVVDAARRLGLKESTVRRRILERKIAYVKNGRAVRVPVEVVEQVIADGWRDATNLAGGRNHG
jgi:excisionase family DNA binding protein